MQSKSLQSLTITFIKNMSTLIQVFSWLFCVHLSITRPTSENINFNRAKISPPQSSLTVCAESGRYLPSAGVKRVKGCHCREETHTPQRLVLWMCHRLNSHSSVVTSGLRFVWGGGIGPCGGLLWSGWLRLCRRTGCCCWLFLHQLRLILACLGRVDQDPVD